MKKHLPALIPLTLLFILGQKANAQSSNPKKDIFPQGTVFFENIPYANDTLKKHLLDIYLPPVKKSKLSFNYMGTWRCLDAER